MSAQPAKRNVRVHQNLHAAVFAALGMSVLWMVAACWLFFSSDLYTGLQIAVVTFFAAAFVLIPLCLWHMGGRRGVPPLSYREWSDGELDLADGAVHASHAAVMVLLAPMAGAVGITAIGFIAALASRGML